MIRTSNFDRCGRHPDAVSIAGWPPPWFLGSKYPDLAPKRWFFDDFKKNNDTTLYTVRFRSLVLGPLDPQKVYDDLHKFSPNPIILCYEAPGDFCHRRIVAEWLETRLRIKVPEYIPVEEVM